jgi:DNA-binding transcriptional MerR regulator
MGAEDKPVTLREMVKRARTTARTVRFYEEVGLLCPVGRSKGGHRLYRAADAEKLELIAELRVAGCSLEQIRTLFALKHSRRDARRASGELQGLLAQRIDELKHRLSLLTRLRDDLGASVAVLQSACAQCKHPPGEELCAACTDIDHDHLPRSFRWIWELI